MICPYCNGDSTVLDSRASTDGIRRRRQCGECKRRFTTYERASAPSIRVTKRSGQTEPFERTKLLNVLARVCRHRITIAKEDVERIATDIEAQLIDANTRSITSGQIASLAIARLRELDRISSERLAVNYVNEDGQLRTEHKEPSDRSQMGLFAGENSDD